MMNVTRIATAQQWDEIEYDWKRLAGPSPCESWEWMRAWWRHYKPRGELYVLLVRSESNEITGITPWYIANSVTQGRTIRVLGSGKVCSDYVSLLVEPKGRSTVTKALAVWLTKNVANRRDPSTSHNNAWDLMELEGVEANDLTMVSLAEALREHQQTVQHEPAHSCWRLTVPNSREEFLASLTKSRRRKFRNILNAYVDSGRAVLRIANDQQSFEKLYLTLVDHHQRRRAFLGDEGCHASRSFSGFLRDVTESFWASDGALLACVDVDGKAAGCSLGFVSRGIHYIYQTGMDPQQQEHQTGWLLNLLHIEYAMRNRIEAIDFMRGDEPYKARFGSEQILGRDYRIVPNKPLAQLRHKVWLAKKSIKEVARGSLAVR